MKGDFIVIDGADGVGKSVLEKAMVSYYEEKGGTVFDSTSWVPRQGRAIPTFCDTQGYSEILTGEPTHYGIVSVIREVVISTRYADVFPNSTILRLFAEDREIQFRAMVGPALEAGLDVIQGRGVSTTFCYQTASAEMKRKDVYGVIKIGRAHV